MFQLINAFLFGYFTLVSGETYRVSMSSGGSLFSHILEEMVHTIQTTDEAQLQCLMMEFALPAGR
jgi:hypothetical protein